VAGKVEMVGATITIMLKELRRKRIKIDDFLATLFLLGIYEDTGSLTFPTTTAEDLEAALYLLKKGARLSYVQRYLSRGWNREAVLLLSHCLENRSCYNVGEYKVIFSHANLSRYSGELSEVVQQLLCIEDADAVFLFAQRGKKTSVVARSRVPALDVASALSFFGGGGHSSAASCTVQKAGSDVISYILSFLQKGVRKKSVQSRENVAEIVKSRIPSSLFHILDEAALLCKQRGWGMYIVGGFVRDALLHRENKDIDIVVEQDAVSVVKELGIKDMECKFFERFGTATIFFEDYRIDFATARQETYTHPGALPIVGKGKILDDLFRRDFTINALAVSCTPTFGALIDPFNGKKDLEQKRIRVMHNFSFIEDPVRILRAVRFCKRLSFTLEEHTRRLIKDAIMQEALSFAPKGRLKDELCQCLSEECAKDIVFELLRMGALVQILKSECINTESLSKIDEASRLCKEFKDFSPSPIFLNLFLLLDGVNVKEAEEFLHFFSFPAKWREQIIHAKKHLLKELSFLQKESKKSKIYKVLSPYCVEALLFAMIKSGRQRMIEEVMKMREKVRVVDGHTIMERFSLDAGPLIGKIKERLIDAYIDGKIRSEEEQIDYVKRLLKERI
jgi:tRNA nucleotidyltransferase/poly(A) polymerase